MNENEFRSLIEASKLDGNGDLDRQVEALQWTLKRQKVKGRLISFGVGQR